MRLKNVPGARETIDASAFTIPEPEVWKGRWQEVFGRQAPLHIEIGMGKGQFLTALAAEHPDINTLWSRRRRTADEACFSSVSELHLWWNRIS